MSVRRRTWRAPWISTYRWAQGARAQRRLAKRNLQKFLTIKLRPCLHYRYRLFKKGTLKLEEARL
ncbi:Hypothetical protein BN69_3507 [Methylocystis sp. SC2]|nr:Hypothetical protein BN69_3507 [Methylocystis sp. SC2]